MSARRGFSVMEVLVAIALLSIAMLPLIQLQRTLADATFRVEAALERASARESALAYLASINISERPEGEMDLGKWRLIWRSDLVAQEANPVGFSGFSNFAVALYRVEARLVSDDMQFTFSVDQVGWTLVRDPLAEFGLNTP